MYQYDCVPVYANMIVNDTENLLKKKKKGSVNMVVNNKKLF